MDGKIEKRMVMAFIGMLLTGISVALFRSARLGTDPFTSFCIGIAFLADSTYGIVYMGISVILFFAIFFIGRKYIGIATFFNIFGLGFIADYFYGIMMNLTILESMTGRVIFMILGIVIMCFAASLYYTAELGVSMYDAVALLMAARKIASFRLSRMGTDLLCVILGFAFGAIIGIGTLITACFMGPLIDYFNRSFSEPFLKQSGSSLLPKRQRKLL